MTSLAAELTDRVIPFVPVRQYVLSLPHRLRYMLAYDHGRCIDVLRVFIRTLMSFYERRAREAGVQNGRTGSVTFIQRFGSAANVNIHFHVVVIDGVFAQGPPDARLSFYATPTPTDEDVAQLVATVRKRIERHLARRGLWELDDNDTDPLVDEAPVLASCYAGSVRGRQTLGRRRGAKLQRIGADPDAPWTESRGRLQAHIEGFDLHAGLSITAQHLANRERLEKVLRYCARPPIADDRLSMRPDGNVALRLKTPWKDGTTHILFEPLDFVAKLAALIPRPHKNLVLYHGVLAPNAAWRARVVAYGRAAANIGECKEGAARAELPRHVRRQWSELMRRAFGFDVLSCAACGGRLRLVAVILERSVIRKILAHVGKVSEPTPLIAARPPPDQSTDLAV